MTMSGVLIDWEAFANDNETRSAVVSIYRSDDSSHAPLDVLGVAVAFQHGPVLVLHALAILHHLAGVAVHSSVPMSSYLFGCCHLESSDCLSDEDQLAVVLTPVSANSVEQFTQPTEFVGLVHSSPKQLVDALHVGLSGSANARHLLAYTSKEQCSIDEALDYEWAMHLSARLLTRLKNGTFSSLSQQSDAKEQVDLLETISHDTAQRRAKVYRYARTLQNSFNPDNTMSIGAGTSNMALKHWGVIVAFENKTYTFDGTKALNGDLYLVKVTHGWPRQQEDITLVGQVECSPKRLLKTANDSLHSRPNYDPIYHNCQAWAMWFSKHLVAEFGVNVYHPSMPRSERWIMASALPNLSRVTIFYLVAIVGLSFCGKLRLLKKGNPFGNTKFLLPRVLLFAYNLPCLTLRETDIDGVLLEAEHSLVQNYLIVSVINPKFVRQFINENDQVPLPTWQRLALFVVQGLAMVSIVTDVYRPFISWSFEPFGLQSPGTWLKIERPICNSLLRAFYFHVILSFLFSLMFTHSNN